MPKKIEIKNKKVVKVPKTPNKKKQPKKLHNEIDGNLREIGFTWQHNPIISKAIRDDTRSFQWVGIEECITPRDYLDLFITTDLLDMVIKSTNYGLRANIKSGITKEELGKYIGIIITSMAKQMETWEEYWTDERFPPNPEFVKCLIPLRRFNFINSRIKFDKNKFKETLCKKFQKAIIPGFNVTIDESRINKPETLEIQTLNDTDSRFLIDMTNPNSFTPHKALQHLSKTLEPYNLKFHITADSQFGSLNQAHRLNQHHFYYTIATMKNRKPSKLFRLSLIPKLKQLKSRIATDESGCAAACYHRNANVLLLTNFFKVVQRHDGLKSSAEEKNQILEYYDDHKRATQQFNQLATTFRNINKHTTLHQALFIGLLGFAVTNAYIIYKDQTENPMDHRNFVYALADDYLGYK